MSDVVVLKQADEKDWDLDRGMPAAEADKNGFRGLFREVQTECRAVHTELTASLTDVEEMAKRSLI